MKNNCLGRRGLSFLMMISILSLVMFSCQVEDVPTLDPLADAKIASQVGQEIVLGERLDNPYTVDNMKAALASLKAQGRAEDDPIQIETTHLYVRFLPADSTEVDILVGDTLLDLYDHPLDYEIEASGDSYHDPEIPEGEITWQYTVVPRDYQFPNVQYEIIEELFMADEEDEEETENGRTERSIWDDLEEEAIRITGNEEEEDGPANALFGKKWYPSGYIKVEEYIVRRPPPSDPIGRSTIERRYIPVRGVKVRARYFTKLRSKHTDSRGYYKISSFKNKVWYSIEWETFNYKITNSIGFSINHNAGSRKKSPWDQSFVYSPTSTSWAGGTMLNAIDHFKKEASKAGLRQPMGSATIKIRPIFKSGSSNVINASIRHDEALDVITRAILYNDIRFFVRGHDDTANIWRVMLHELGHINHILLSPGNFQGAYRVDPLLVESWARAIEHYFLPINYAITDDPRTAAVEGIPDQSRQDIEGDGGTDWQYSPFFVDLRDNTNQRRNRGGNPNFADDNVSGYTLLQLQDAVRVSRNIEQIERFLTDNFNNGTERNIPRLRDFYEDIKDAN